MPVPTRTSADANASADINSLQTQITSLSASYTLSTPGTDQTLTSASVARQSMAPSVDISVTLDNSFSAGAFIELQNTSTTKVITLKSNDGSTICKVIPLSWLIIAAKQATPTATTHWSTKSAGGGYVSGVMVAGDFSAGFGTVTSVTSRMRREGGDLLMDFNATTGTVAPSAATVTLPFSMSRSSGVLSVQRLGYYFKIENSVRLYADASNAVGVLFYDSGSGATKMRLTVYGDTSNFLNENGNDCLANTKLLNFQVRAPISGWELNG